MELDVRNVATFRDISKKPLGTIGCIQNKDDASDIGVFYRHQDDAVLSLYGETGGAFCLTSLKNKDNRSPEELLQEAVEPNKTNSLYALRFTVGTDSHESVLVDEREVFYLPSISVSEIRGVAERLAHMQNSPGLLMFAAGNFEDPEAQFILALHGENGWLTSGPEFFPNIQQKLVDTDSSPHEHWDVFREIDTTGIRFYHVQDFSFKLPWSSRSMC